MGNFLSRQTNAEGQGVAATDVQVEGVPVVSKDAEEQVERIDERISAGEPHHAPALSMIDGVPADMVEIMAQGLHEEEDVQSLPTLQSALQDLKAKHGINMGDAPPQSDTKLTAMAEQEARLRDLLKNKKRPAPKLVLASKHLFAQIRLNYGTCCLQGGTRELFKL